MAPCPFERRGDSDALRPRNLVQVLLNDEGWEELRVALLLPGRFRDPVRTVACTPSEQSHAASPPG